jgi:hypothetical protein
MSKKEKDGNFFKRHKILSVIGVIIIIAIIASAAGGGSKKNAATTASSGSSSNSSSSSKSATTVGLNQEADDGSFGFTVTGIDCGQTTITAPSNQYETATAQGQFCVLHFTIKNIKDKSQSYDSSTQYVYSVTGTQYVPSTDIEAQIAANDGSNCPDDPAVNPGVSMTCSVAFDVPAGTTPAYAMLHDSSLSGGVKVKLQ